MVYLILVDILMNVCKCELRRKTKVKIINRIKIVNVVRNRKHKRNNQREASSDF